jgi:plasmid stabilization system protein ParE
MRRFSISPQARADLKEIWKYIARDSITAADRMLERFLATFRGLAAFPESGQT